MAYKYLTQFDSPNFNTGRPAGSADGIIIHHWDDPAKKPSFSGVVSWLCNPASGVSAHYVAESGKVACLVDPDDRAWHAGNLGNPRKIGIECNPRMSQGDLETVAELIANLRKVYGNIPLSVHSDYMQTSCPGAYAGKIAHLNARANQILTGQGRKPASPTKPAKPGKLVPDQFWGTGTTLAAQNLYGTPTDRVVSSQPAYYRSQYGNNLTTGWEWADDPKGSQLIGALQKQMNSKGHNLKVDKLAGPKFWAAFIKYMGGRTLAEAIGNFQIRLNEGWK